MLEIASSYGAGDLRPRLELTLIESGPRLLAAFPEAVAQAAAQQLRVLGITVRTGVRVTGADETGLTFKDGLRIEVSLRVWAAGVRASDAVAALRMNGCLRWVTVPASCSPPPWWRVSRQST